MNTLALHRPGENQHYVQSWVFSVLLHGAAVGTAIALVADLHLAPQPEPFKWDVSVVETPMQSDNPRPAPTETRPVEPQPVTQPAQQVVRQEVRQEVREVRPVVQTTIQSTQVVNRTVQAIDTPQTVPVETTEAVTTSEALPVVREAEAPLMSPVMAETLSASPPEPTVVSRPVVEATQPAVRQLPVRSAPATKVDYGWLAEALWSKVEQLKRYPHMARMNRWEGRVVLRVVIREDGHLLDLAVAESSGHSVLDQDALEILRQASPLKLKHPLGKSQVVVQVPISYRLQ